VQIPVQKKKMNVLIPIIIAIVVVLVLGIGAFAVVSSGLIEFPFNNDTHFSDDDDNDREDEENVYDTESEVAEDEEIVGQELFEDVDETFILNVVLPAYEDIVSSENIVKGITLFYYNDDMVPELYIHDSEIVYMMDADECVYLSDITRAKLLVRGIDIVDFVKSKNIDDAYLVLTDPNYSMKNVDYILPTSSIEYLTKEDLIGLTAEECRIARNEIYARHGRMFTSEDLQAYFDSKDWYIGTIPAEQFSEDLLNVYEKANGALITQYEIEMGYRS